MKKCIVVRMLSISLSLAVITGCGKKEVSQDQAGQASEKASAAEKSGRKAQKKKKTEETVQKAGQETEKETEQETGQEEGRFQGSYEGDDGCRYEFAEDGTLTVAFDGAVFEYQYTLQDHMLTITEEGRTPERKLEVTMLESGTYLLEDTDGTQIVLTYLKE